MSSEILYIDRSSIREGKLEDVEQSIRDLVEFIESNEPRLTAYGFYIDTEAMTMTVVALHPDSESLELHMEIGGPAFRGFADLIDMRGIEVYGHPSERVRQLLDEKARMLGDGARVSVVEKFDGFARLEPATHR